MKKLIFASVILVFTFFQSQAQNEEFNSIGIGDAPNSSQSKLTIKRGWGDYIQFKRTSDNGYFGISNDQAQSRLGFYFGDGLGNFNFRILNMYPDGKIKMGDVSTPMDTDSMWLMAYSLKK